MRKFYAVQGKIPRQGEVWLPVGDKAHLMMLHLIDVESIKAFIPEELTIRTILPGKTLGLIFMTSMGPDSTLPYHEFMIAPAFVHANGKSGFYVTHIFVDNEASQIGGRRNFGLDKQMAEFHWDWKPNEPGFISIQNKEQTLLSIAYAAPVGRIPLRLGGGVFSFLEDKLIWCNNLFKAKYGLTKVGYTIARESVLWNDWDNMGITKPLLSIMGKNMRGFMGDDTQVTAFFPDRMKY